jgi:hypothetical protein
MIPVTASHDNLLTAFTDDGDKRLTKHPNVKYFIASVIRQSIGECDKPVIAYFFSIFPDNRCMAGPSSPEITQMLAARNNGGASALVQLTPAADPRRRTAILRRAESGGDGRGAYSFSQHRQARLECG